MDYFIISTKPGKYIPNCMCGLCGGFGCWKCKYRGIIDSGFVCDNDKFILFDINKAWHRNSAESYGTWKKHGDKYKFEGYCIINMEDI